MGYKLIDDTGFYKFERLHLSPQEFIDCPPSNRVSTTYIHKGRLLFAFDAKEFLLSLGQGFIVAPGIGYSLSSVEELVAYRVSSEVRRDRPLVEIVDLGTCKEEIPLVAPKIITDPKRVEKPWGCELWIGYNNYHVLKRISKMKGRESSFHFHRQKVETNYLESGTSNVIEHRLDSTLSIEEIIASAKEKEHEAPRNISSGDFWTSHPYIAHRVIPLTNYIAYEASTPELDDVIRIQDDFGRGSGRIIEEHRGGIKNG
ncbi:MAG: hypothetical protein WC548_03735 [Candidatus Pacearchaeota archaeon]